ncbi:MAG: ABC transporter ATP-binding protein [Wenzhouxiangellaceae bacterium]|nr:ABC transporter ATP-binding protein [Wenzhouxiangellaceae bacterium]
MGEAAEALLRVDSLDFAFRDRRVLNGVALEVAEGEIVALLGPNGSGKSTLMRAICGRLQPDSGSISINGRNPHTDRRARALIGLVPQQIALYPHLSVAENVRAFARLSGTPAADVANCSARAVELCDLAEVAARRAGELSGGWQRRANIACAVAHSPRLLVLDEPTVGIDPPARREIESLLGRLAGQGIGILLTSHDLGQLERLAHRVAFMIDGRVAVSGAPDTLITEYFDQRRECSLVVDRPPSDEQAGKLALAGLGVGDDGGKLHWSGLVDEQVRDTQLEHLLGDLGLSEWRVRRPGLDSLWRHLYGQAPSADIA